MNLTEKTLKTIENALARMIAESKESQRKALMYADINKRYYEKTGAKSYCEFACNWRERAKEYEDSAKDASEAIQELYTNFPELLHK